MNISKKIKNDKIILQQKVDNFNRKIIHILSAVIIIFFPYFFSLQQIIMISLFFSFLFALARIFAMFKIFNLFKIINKVNRISWGEIFYPLGVMLSAIFFLPDRVLSFQFGILVLGLSDALANIFGSLFGSFRIKVFGGVKSLEGSLVFFLTTFILLLLLNGCCGGPLIFSYLLITLILTIIEFSLFFGLDNLFLPILASYLFTLI
ncbi:MAG: hypothetical protein PHP37_03495 [Patescibacteria group bacterium]|nr:hypothetical protein [Patescibacteria group bacterium]